MKRFLLLAITAGLLSSCSTYTPKDPKLLCAKLVDNSREYEKAREKMNSYKLKMIGLDRRGATYRKFYDEYQNHSQKREKALRKAEDETVKKVKVGAANGETYSEK